MCSFKRLCRRLNSSAPPLRKSLAKTKKPHAGITVHRPALQGPENQAMQSRFFHGLIACFKHNAGLSPLCPCRPPVLEAPAAAYAF